MSGKAWGYDAGHAAGRWLGGVLVGLLDRSVRLRWHLARLIAPGGQDCSDPWECCLHCRENNPGAWSPRLNDGTTDA